MATGQQEVERVNINFERRDLNSRQKSQLLHDDFGETCFFFCF